MKYFITLLMLTQMLLLVSCEDDAILQPGEAVSSDACGSYGCTSLSIEDKDQLKENPEIF
tara:strand:- start:914 stop:1093 length:180 start_codon:yes stop_codon:yes gene_type:complete